MPSRSTCPPKQNRILGALPITQYARLSDDLEAVSLELGQVLYDAGDNLSVVYFPATCIVSMIFTTLNGSSAELAMIGSDGLIGMPLVLGGNTTTHRVVVQRAGIAYRLKAEIMRWELDQGSDLLHLCLRYIQALMTQLAQSVVCNRHHSIDQQVSRWLLLCLDLLSENKIDMTQEVIAGMLGVRREAVTEAAGKLQAAGVIHYSRGHIVILDRLALEARACECYAEVKTEYDRLFELPANNRINDRARPNPATLRRRAEARLLQNPTPVSKNAWDAAQIKHELEVHQIELEMHNETLRQAYEEADALRDRYADIYDFSPVSYFTLNSQGGILDLNLAGAILLGVQRSRRSRHRFSAFVKPENLSTFNVFLGHVLQAKTRCSCEIELTDIAQRHEIAVRIEAVANERGDECRMVVMDITERRDAMLALKISEQRYRRLSERN